MYELCWKFRFRNAFTIFDSNTFARAWATAMFLEAAHFKDDPVPTDSQLYLPLEAFGQFHVHQGMALLTSGHKFAIVH